MAAYLGSEAHYAGETDWGTTWFAPLTVDSLHDIKLAYDPQNAWWQRTQAIVRAAVARWGNYIVLGHTNLGGNLDILASLRSTQKLLLGLDASEEINRLTRQITSLWLRYYDEMQAIIDNSSLETSHWSEY